MAEPTTFLRPDEWINEGTTPIYETTLTDVDGVTTLLPAQLVTLTLTLYDLEAGPEAIVNAVNHVNILNTGRGSLSAGGLLTIQFLAADMAILDPTHRYERRRLLLKWSYGVGGVLVGSHEVDIVVRNLSHVPYVAP